MEQICELCDKEFSGDVIWYIPAQDDYKLICLDCEKLYMEEINHLK